MTNPTKSSNRQFYHLFRQLSTHVDNERDLSQIVAYSVVKGLISFQPQTKQLGRERELEELRSTYEELENSIMACNSSDPYSHLCELKGQVNPVLSDYIQQAVEEGVVPDTTIPSGLLSKLVEKLTRGHRKDFSDRLKRQGSQLYHWVMEDKARIRTIDALNQNYGQLERALTK